MIKIHWKLNTLYNYSLILIDTQLMLDGGNTSVLSNVRHDPNLFS